MGEFADVRRKRMYRFLCWLVNNKSNITIEDGGKHQYLIKYTRWDRPYPIPFKHNIINKHIVKKLMKKLVDSEILTEDEFGNHL